MRTKPELAAIISSYGKQLGQQVNLSPLQAKTLGNIAQCRSAALGGHEEACDSCGAARYSYNSCGDRHCPKCQAVKQVLWIDELQQKTLAIKHFHVVFTAPHELNAVCLHNQRQYYDLLFSAVWHTLRLFGYTHHGSETGAIAVLHTWGQNLSLHPHVHCIVPAAGYTLDGKWKAIGQQGNFLYPVQQLSATFKGRFLDSLKRALRKQNELALFNDLLQAAYRTKWVVHCEPSMAGAEHVIKYLGQYTHRVAITNHRIISMADDKVTFMAKDYRDNDRKKPVSLHAVEFLRRFSMHILPKRFVKIRYYGIYNHTLKRNLGLQFAEPDKTIDSLASKQQPAETNLQRFERLTGVNPCLCPVCKKGRMVVVKVLPRIRSPGNGVASCFSLSTLSEN